MDSSEKRLELYSQLKRDILYRKAEFYNWKWIYTINIDNSTESVFYGSYIAGTERNLFKSHFEMYFFNDDGAKITIINVDGRILEVFRIFLEKGFYCGISNIYNTDSNLIFSYELFNCYINK